MALTFVEEVITDKITDLKAELKEIDGVVQDAEKVLKEQQEKRKLISDRLAVLRKWRDDLLHG